MNTIVVGYRVFAMMRAKRMAQDDVKRKGHKWSSYTAAEKQAMTMLYLELHPEIVKQAKADIDKLTLEGAFGKRAARALRAKLKSDAQTQEPLNSMGSAVQMSGAK